MNAPASDLIALPARINAAGMKAVRDSLTFPEGYSNYYAKDKPYSASVNELMANHADASNHALIRDLMKTTLPVGTIATAINAYWFRDDYNALLHNTLLIIDQMHREGYPIQMNILSSAVGAITYAEKDETPSPLTTHTKLKEAIVVIRFITAMGTDSYNVSKRKIGTGYYYSIANPYLDKLLRSNIDAIDDLIDLLKQRRILRTKKGLAPVLLALHDDRIKAFVAEKPELMDKMFDYYYERNPGDASDITPLLGYFATTNALTNGYL